ncbi:MAG: Hpt domain-containing protein [Vulcanimicrobiota bacterium]
MADFEVDQELLDTLVDGDVEFAQDLIDTYVTSTTEQLVELRAAADRGQAQAFTKTVHTIKGASASLGQVSTQAFALSLERAARAENLEFCRQNLEGFEAAVRASHAYLRQYLNSFTDS